MSDDKQMRLDQTRMTPNPETETIELHTLVYLKQFDKWFDISFDLVKLCTAVIDKLEVSEDGTAETTAEVKVKAAPAQAREGGD